MQKSHQKPSNPSVILGIVALAFVARLAGLTAQGLWRDEVDQWRFALSPWAELWSNFTRPGWNGPLFSPMLRVWIMLTGESVWAMRYFSLLWGVLSVAMAYTLLRRLLGAPAARWTTLLLALSPYQVWYAQEIKMYTWVPLLALLILYATERAFTQRIWWGVVIAGMGVLAYSHILGPLLLPVLLLWGMTQAQTWRTWIMLAGVALLIAGLALPLLMWQAPLLFQERETGFTAMSFGAMAQTLLNAWSMGLNAPAPADLFGQRMTLSAMLMGGGLAFGGALWLAFTRQFSVALKLLSWLALPLTLLWAISLRAPLFTDRYLIWCAPAFYALIAVTLAALQRHTPRLAWGLAALLLVINGAGLYRQSAYPGKPQFAAAAEYLRAHRAADALLLFQIPYNHYVMGYYYGALDPWAEAPYTNWRLADGAYQVNADYVDEQMRALIGPRREVWLVSSEAWLWDERGLVKAWLDARGRPETEVAFFGVTLYHYWW